MVLNPFIFSIFNKYRKLNALLIDHANTSRHLQSAQLKKICHLWLIMKNSSLIDNLIQLECNQIQLYISCFLYNILNTESNLNLKNYV